MDQRLEEYKAYCADVKRAAVGQWGYILGVLCPELDPALERLGKHVPCPSHGGKDGFRLIRGRAFDEAGVGVCNSCNGGKPMDGFELINWCRGDSFNTAIKEVGKVLGLEWKTGQKDEPAKPVVRRPPPPDRSAEIAAAIAAEHERAGQKIDKVLAECQEVDWDGDNPVTRYLRLRGLELAFSEPPKDLLIHPGLPYWDATEVNGKTEFKNLGVFPAMIAIMRDLDGKIVTLHRTYLTAEGYKADVPSARKVMSPRASMTGAAIQLYDAPGDGMIVGEGIETVMAAWLANRRRKIRVSARSLYNTTLLAGYTAPARVNRLMIYGDHDESGAGENAAKTLASRHPHAHPKIALPPNVGEDWNDFYCRATGKPSPGRSTRRPRTVREPVAAGVDDEESEREAEILSR